MKYFELELNGETIKFRLTSNDCMVIEKSTGKSIIEYVQNLSISTVVNLLRYMRRSDVPNFSEKDATALYDKLVDAGYTLATIIDEILLEALAVSGFMSQEELTELKSNKNSKK